VEVCLLPIKFSLENSCVICDSDSIIVVFWTLILCGTGNRDEADRHINSTHISRVRGSYN